MKLKRTLNPCVLKPVNKQSGFTLVELLVALFIFSLLSVAGVALLRSSADGQIALKQRLGDHSAVIRTANLLEADLAQAAALPIRTADGASIAAFGNASAADTATPGLLFAFSRTGVSGGSDSSSVGRAAYAFSNGILTRRFWPVADGANAAPAASLLNDLESVRVRFRSNDGQWRSDWTATEPKALPRALELIIKPKLRPEFRMVMLVGPQVRIVEEQVNLQDGAAASNETPQVDTPQQTDVPQQPAPDQPELDNAI
jgi:general secretion pathway protein J